MNEPETILDMLGGPGHAPRTLAVIGLSDDPFKPSFYVSDYMQQHGFRLLPVNPSLSTVLGETCYPSLASLPEKPDIVNVFRLPSFIPRNCGRHARPRPQKSLGPIRHPAS